MCVPQLSGTGSPHLLAGYISKSVAVIYPKHGSMPILNYWSIFDYILKIKIVNALKCTCPSPQKFPRSHSVPVPSHLLKENIVLLLFIFNIRGEFCLFWNAVWMQVDMMLVPGFLLSPRHLRSPQVCNPFFFFSC